MPSSPATRQVPSIRRRAPIDCAPSSMIASPCFRAIGTMRSIGAIWPNRCTTTMARVRGVIAASMASGCTLNVAASMSTKTGVPPALWIAPAVAKNVNGGRDDLVARLEVQGPERQQQGVGAARAGDGMPDVRKRRDRLLQRRDLGAHDEGLALDDGAQGRLDLIANRVVLGDQVEQGDVHRHISHVWARTEPMQSALQAMLRLDMAKF